MSKFYVSFAVDGTCTVEVRAANVEEAEKQAEAIMNEADFNLENGCWRQISIEYSDQ